MDLEMCYSMKYFNSANTDEASYVILKVLTTDSSWKLIQPNVRERRKEESFDLRELEVQYTVVNMADMTVLQEEERPSVTKKEWAGEWVGCCSWGAIA